MKIFQKKKKFQKRNYKPLDVPDLAALDIVTSEQFTAMIDFLEAKLVRDVEEEHNVSVYRSIVYHFSRVC